MHTKAPGWLRRLHGLFWLGLTALPAAGCALTDSEVFQSQSGPNMIAGQTVGVAGGLGNDPWAFWEYVDFTKPDVPPPPAETLVIRPDGLVPDKEVKPGSYEAELAGAHEYFRRGEFAKAEGLFRRLGQNKKVPPLVAQEAVYYQAESLRQMSNYPDAADTYVRLCNDFPQSPYKEMAVQHAYNIANYWLDETRASLHEAEEVREGKRWFVTPRFFHIDKTMPFMDYESRAIEKLDQVRFADISGPLADKALFLAGMVKFQNGDFKDADHYLSQVYEKHPKSELAPVAIEYAIISKNMSTGGADYDGRKAAEARMLVHAAFNYPELKGKQNDLLEKLRGIDIQQALSDYNTAEFYRRQGVPTSAYFYYELVVRRYPNTEYAQKAAVKLEEMKQKIEEQGGAPVPRRPATLGGPAREDKPGAVPAPQGFHP